MVEHLVGEPRTTMNKGNEINFLCHHKFMECSELLFSRVVLVIIGEEECNVCNMA